MAVISGTDPTDYGNMFNITGLVQVISGNTIHILPNEYENILYGTFVTSGTLSVENLEFISSASLDLTVNLNPTPLRTSADKTINLTNLLPVHLEYSETGEFLEFFETFLNELYDDFTENRDRNDLFTVDSDGNKSYFQVSADGDENPILVDPGFDGTSSVPLTSTIQPSPMISILEKAKRISDFHDPDLIDIEYIQRLANYLGYDINVHREAVDGLTSGAGDDGYDTQRYLRFIVSNLPNWYNIKATDNAIKVLLYSFGLVGDVIKKWTTDQLAATVSHPQSGGYGEDLSLWRSEESDLLSFENLVSAIPENYFPTPHFDIRINQDQADESWFNNLDQTIEAIDAIRPINTVFDELKFLFFEQFSPVSVRSDFYTHVKIFIGRHESDLAMNQFKVWKPRGSENFTSASENLEVRWGIGFNSTCASPVSSVNISISYDNGETYNLAGQGINLSGADIFETTDLGIFTSAFPIGSGDGSNSIVRIVERIDGLATGASAFSNNFTVS
jgi:hypothetical protein